MAGASAEDRARVGLRLSDVRGHAH